MRTIELCVNSMIKQNFNTFTLTLRCVNRLYNSFKPIGLNELLVFH